MLQQFSLPDSGAVYVAFVTHAGALPELPGGAGDRASGAVRRRLASSSFGGHGDAAPAAAASLEPPGVAPSLDDPAAVSRYISAVLAAREAEGELRHVPLPGTGRDNLMEPFVVVSAGACS